MELDYKAIGKRIKIARIKADLTQERLAEMVEISPTHMSNIETGTTRVSLTAIVSLANALSVTVDDLLCDSVVKSKVQFEKDTVVLKLLYGRLELTNFSAYGTDQAVSACLGDVVLPFERIDGRIQFVQPLEMKQGDLLTVALG